MARSPWITRLARLGYAVKGVTYFLISMLALRAALGDGNPQNTRGALRVLQGAVLGNILLAAIAFGLAAYALWKLYFAAFNPEREEPRERIGAAFVAFVNIGFAIEAARLALNATRGSGSDQAAHWSRIIMAQPMGVVAIGLTGIGIASYGLSRIVKGIKSKLDDQLGLHEPKDGAHVAVVGVARIGIAARGVAFLLVGFFLVRAALKANPAEAKDIGHSLQELSEQPYGAWLLFAVAGGLFLYGVYELVRAKYRRFET